MSEIYQTLSQMVAAAPQNLNTLVEGAISVKGSVEQLESNLQEKETEVASLIQKITQALEDLQQQANQQQTEIETEINQIQSESEALKAQIEEAQTELASEMQSNQEKFTAFKDQIEQDNTAMETASEEMQTALNQMRDKLDSEQKQLVTAQDTVVDSIGVLKEKIEIAKTTAEEKVTEFGEKIETTDGEVNERCDLLFTTFNDERESFNTKFSDINQQVIREQVDGLLDELQENIESELKELAEAAVQEIAESISEISGKITEAKEESETKRAIIEPLFDQVEGLLSPIEYAVENVNRVADSLGVG